MKKVLVVAAVVAALVWVVKSQGRYSWGQKLTVTVETPAGVIAVPEAQYPMLVTLGDMADPASVRLVDPGDLAASFGQGVRLKAVTLELTGEAVTKGVVGGVLGCIRQNNSCVLLNLNLPYGDPMRNVPNYLFFRRKSL